MTSPWEGREHTYRVAWQSPDSFHVLYPNVTVEYETGKDPVITDHGFVEAIAIGDRMYTRQCAEEGDGLRALGGGSEGRHLRAHGRNRIWTPCGPSNSSASCPMRRSSARRTWTASSAPVFGARANVTQAMVQSWRRAEEIRGPLYWGEECTTTDQRCGRTQ